VTGAGSSRPRSPQPHVRFWVLSGADDGLWFGPYLVTGDDWTTVRFVHEGARDRRRMRRSRWFNLQKEGRLAFAPP
jgi:hypothetical protein